MPFEKGIERIFGERKKTCIRLRDDGRHTHALLEERSLAEIFTSPDLAEQRIDAARIALRDPKPSGEDHVHTVGALALADGDLTREEDDRNGYGAEVFELAWIEHVEEVRLTQLLGEHRGAG